MKGPEKQALGATTSGCRGEKSGKRNQGRGASKIGKLRGWGQEAK